MTLLDADLKRMLSGYVELASDEIEDPPEIIESVCRERTKGLSRGDHSETVTARLQDEWYRSLESGSPDYSVYDTFGYVVEAWACWVVHARRYLKLIRTLDLEDVRSVVDVGCGVGYSTAALKQMFPHAIVVGTQLEGKQARIARRLAKEHEFILHVGTLDELDHADIVFASEYFEHFDRPVEHLREIEAALSPKMVFSASAFGQRAIGHFPEYVVDEKTLGGRATASAFGRETRKLGFQKIKTSWWNERPKYYRKPS